ncbi:MAG: hypothetical protein KAT32_01755 [Candidatus Moranbacteria bacterium]|nr:hypothetical protein [Candidatus Moranbacteria bacterium]
MRNYFLSKTKIPEKLSVEMQGVIDDLKQSSNQEECLQKVYKIMTSRYRGYKLRTYRRFFNIFTFNVEKLWNDEGFIHCHNANFLLRILLVKSGFFKNEDIENKWTLTGYLAIHQYLKIKLYSGKNVNIDVWGASYGIKFGDYSNGFH